MKKTFTLLAIAFLFSATSFAQYNHPRDKGYNDDRDMAVNMHRDRDGRGYGKTYYFTAKEKNTQIALINREYDRKITSVKRMIFVGRSKKIETIKSLEYSRRSEIREVIEKFNDRRNRFDGKDDRRGNRNNW